MIITKKEMKEIESPESIICDVCGKEYDIEDYLEIQEFHHIDFVGGYGSIFGDQSRVECDICQNCLKEMIENFCRIETYYICEL
jgi:hypothetical protein